MSTVFKYLLLTGLVMLGLCCRAQTVKYKGARITYSKLNDLLKESHGDSLVFENISFQNDLWTDFETASTPMKTDSIPTTIADIGLVRFQECNFSTDFM